MNTYFLEEIQKIAEDLMREAKADASGIFWETISSRIPDLEFYYSTNTNIYQGSGGVSLLFLELFRVTKDTQYLYYVEQSLAWLVNFIERNQMRNFQFITGDMSIVYLLARAYEVLDKKSYLHKALEFCKDAERSLNSPLSEYLNGKAGTLYCLLYVYSLSKEEWLLDVIVKFIHSILSAVNLDKSGIYWDREERTIKGLCGFSHGASGIAYVFLELGQYFQNPVFIWLAEQAFEYENQFYSSTEKNWQDLRKAIFDEESERQFFDAFRNQDFAFFEQGTYMSAWCHGSPGIGMARLRAFELTQKQKYWEETQAAIENVLDKLHFRNSPNLCHGTLGNLELLLEAYRSGNEESQWDVLTKVTQQVIEYKPEVGYYRSGLSLFTGKDIALFMGNAGVAYFLLRLVDWPNTPSMLMPRITFSQADTPTLLDTFHFRNVHEQIVSQRFPKTLEGIGHLHPKQLKLYFLKKNPTVNVLNSFMEFVESLLGLPHRHQQQLKDSYAYEKCMVELDLSQKSYAYTYYKSHLYGKEAGRLLDLPEKVFSQHKVFLNSELVVKETAWDWNGDSIGYWERNLKIPPSRLKSLFLPKFWGVQAFGIASELMLALCEVFRSAKDLQQGKEE
ncbi:MAG: lanthionine synthetase LanC family protein, partial [Bacteroidota bacterium]